MITTWKHAMEVQTRRRESGKKGRSKAVRRWFKRSEIAPTIDVHYGQAIARAFRYQLSGNFEGCVTKRCT